MQYLAQCMGSLWLITIGRNGNLSLQNLSEFSVNKDVSSISLVELLESMPSLWTEHVRELYVQLTLQRAVMVVRNQDVTYSEVPECSLRSIVH